MDYRDRDKIDHCCNNISSKINMRSLWPKLLEYKVFDWDDVNVSKWEKTLDQEDTVRDILYTTKTRGPQAFENLILCLRATNHKDVADILEGTMLLASHDNIVNDNRELLSNAFNNSDIADNSYCKTKLTTTNEPLVIKVQHATKFMDELDSTGLGKYYMRCRPHGYVLIITIIDYITEPRRNAAEHDQANLKKLFEDMGFKVFLPDPGTLLTGAEINRIVKEFSQQNFSKVNSCFVIISAHGNEIEKHGASETEIHGFDYNLTGSEKVLCSDLISMFTTENCKHLIEKPKVFIFQTCRGEAEQITSRYATDGSVGKALPRNYSDIFIAHSTLPGHKAYRDEYNGSWYIQVLCEVFMHNACTMHLVDLFHKVDGILKTIRTLDGRAQTSTFNTMGVSKHLYLNPGIFDDS